MGMLTDFFVASRADANGLLGGGARGAAEVLLKRVDTVKLDSLAEILAEQLGREESDDTTTLLTDPASETAWVMLVSPAVIDMLTQLGDHRASVANAWAATPELKRDRFTIDGAQQVIDALATLAGEAKASGRDVLLRISL